MTAEGLLLLLEEMGVVLAPDQDGNIDYLTQEGALPICAYLTSLASNA